MEAGAKELIADWTRELSERLAATLEGGSGAAQGEPWQQREAKRVYWPWPNVDLRTVASAITAVRAEAADEWIEAACAAATAGAAAIEVAPRHLAAAVAALRMTPVCVAAIVGDEGELTTVKLHAMEEALKLGADEIVWIPSPKTAELELRSAARLGAEAGARLMVGARTAGRAVDLRTAALRCGITWVRVHPAQRGAVWELEA
ncbi:MAG TPA: hypothetical protein VE996_08065 [Terriglobales bacterium]|nr:hypothetical protein [Terriglobales bacterium]